ncbi:MAG: FHA domain-containing protein [Leptolyngbyaceae cyanobacterium RU_5_1]|nr:FHA domain-containing protein [Leptolyngbyaceae cyanobacterium RU_5_1]
MLILKSVNFEQGQFQHHQLKQSYSGQVEWLIGRNPTSDLVLPNPEISRTHGQIAYIDDAYYFIDVGSKAGSLLNGKTISANDKQKLHPGDLLQLGETFLYVEELTSPAPSASDPPTYPAFVQPEQHWQNEDLVCRCCRIVDETRDVKTFYLIAEPAVLFDYKPGQFVNLEVEIDGKSVIRSYSISSSPTRPYHLTITVKRVPSPPNQPDVPAGLMSNWLHDHFKVGDRLNLLGGPLGHFTCLPNVPPKLLLISAGSGITPMMSMSRWVQDALVDCDVIFLHSARTPDDIVFRSELEAIAAQIPNFHLAVTLTQPPLGHPWMGLTGRISESMLQMVAPDFLERAVYVCGPNGFMQSTRTLLEAMQFPMQNYKEESFGGKKEGSSGGKQSNLIQVVPLHPTVPPQPEQTIVAAHKGNGHSPGSLPADASPFMNATPVINFIKSERSAMADGSASILEVAEQEGIQMRSACRVGACGACKIRVHQGNVRYDAPPAALTPADQQAGYALACVAYADSNLAIEA